MKHSVSLIICTFDRPEQLREALQSITHQQLDGTFDLEVLVVDNSPNGRMGSTVDSFQKESSGNLKYLREPAQGKCRALNLGIQQAKGDLIAFTDDDVIADPMWLKTLINGLIMYDCDGVGGRVLPIYPDATPQWIKDNAVQMAGGVVIYDYGEDTFHYEPKYYPFIGANYAFKRSVFDTCGLFRTDLGPGTPILGEDTEFIERLLKQDKILYYCGKALIRHPVDLKRVTLSHMARWHLALGRFAARREAEKKEKISVYYFGVPRYLWKGIIIDGISIVLGVFNRIKFLNAWRAFFRKAGMIEEYSAARKQGSK